MLITLLLSLAPFAQAVDFTYSAADLARQRSALAEVSSAFGHADSQLPPCEAQAYMVSAISQYQPAAKACPQVGAYFSAMLKLGKKLEENCREATSFALDSLKDPGLCARPHNSEVRAHFLGIHDAERKAAEETGNPSINEFDLEKPTGELTNMDCELALTIALQYRRRALSLVTKNFSKADASFDETCDPKNKEPIDFPQYSRLGEKMYSDQKR